MPAFKTIEYDKKGGIAHVRLDRPSVHNAYDTAMRDDVFQAMEAARDDGEVRVVVISGKGRSFCAGADLTEFGSAPSVTAAREARWGRDVWGLFLSMDKPLLAAVHGHCVGSGLEMAMLCDLRVAAGNALFAMPEARLGLMPAAGGSQTLPRSLGASKGLDLLLTGRRVDATEALALGLVSRVVPESRLSAEAESLAESLAALDPPAVAAVKKAMRHGSGMSLAQGLTLEARLSLRLAAEQGRAPSTPSHQIEGRFP